MTVASFIVDFPEFRSEKEDVVSRHIGYATGGPAFLDESRWGTYYSRGLGYFVAHSIVMEKMRIAAGPVAMAGDLASQTIENANGRVTKSTDSGSIERRQKNPFYETKYGQEYLRLQRLAGMGAVAV